jgi:hypothetical protein
MVSGQFYVPAALLTGIHWTGSWVGPTAGLDEENILAPASIQTPVVRLVA